VFTIWSTTPQFDEIPLAYHLIGSWSADLKPWLNTGVEVYGKLLKNLIMPTDPGITQQGDGDAMGIEFRAEVFKPSLYAYASYSLSSVWYHPDEGGFAFSDGPSRFESFRPPHDRRHVLNLVARYTKGKYSAALKFQYGSGLPFTKIAGFYDHISPVFANQGFHQTVGSTRILYADPFRGRLPAYHSLDITLERTFGFSGVRGKLLGGVINAYNRDNLFYYDVWNNERINQLPLVPTLGLKLDID